jgi:hypothetical protein
MYLMDSFLGGQFSTYGMDVIRISGMEASSLFREIAIFSVYPFLKPIKFTLFLKLPDISILPVYPIFGGKLFDDKPLSLKR